MYRQLFWTHDAPPVTPQHAAHRREADDDDGAPIQLAWKEGELRLANSPTRSGPHFARPAKCADTERKELSGICVIVLA